MAFQTPITIKKALDNIQANRYLLPAIQREFVWRPEQIERLFDSLMRGYPIGSFLFWKVSPESARDYNFYKCWLIRSLLKRGVWGSGLDTLLVAIRSAIRESAGQSGFPTDQIEAAMRRRGKNLTFSDEEIEDLADTPFSRSYSVLALLYDFVDVANNRFHVDHVFPRALLTPARLRKAGVDEADLGEYAERVNRLPNLQLLEGTENSAKGATLPLEWLKRNRTPEEVQHYSELHDLGQIPDGIDGFLQFYEARRARIVAKLRARLAE